MLWLALTPVLAAPPPTIGPDEVAPPTASREESASLEHFIRGLDASFSAIVTGSSPSDVLPVEVEAVTPPTPTELAELLTRSGAVRARVEAIELHLAWSDQAVRLTLSPRTTTVQSLQLGLSTEEIAAAMSPYLWREPFTALAKATTELGETLRSSSCSTLRFSSDEELAAVVPAEFRDRAQARRNASRAQLQSLCPALAGSEAELRVGVGEIHVNLYDASGAVVGGLRTNITRPVPPYRLAFPQFKAIR